MIDRPLLLVGASVRAAAWSARRAGFAPHGLDWFADRDLSALGPALRLERYPFDAWRRFNTAAPREAWWMYTGGLESYPRLIDRLARRRRLLGVAGATLRQVRDPFTLAAALADTDTPLPELAPHPPTADGAAASWLCKRRRSSGGLGVSVWRPDDARPDFASRGGVYWQRRIAGRVLGAVFVAAGGEARLLGVAEQLVGLPWTDAPPFAYAGSLGPIELTARSAAQLQSLGATLARRFALVGLFGVDLIDDGDRLWTLEVNPRYTASVEVLERATGLVGLAAHADACQLGLLPATASCAFDTGGLWHGKAVLFAPRRLQLSAAAADELWRWANPGDRPAAADIPWPGTVVEPGQPIVTLLAAGATRAAVLARLAELAATWRDRFARDV